MFEWLFRLSLRVNREHVMVKILVLGILISFIAVLLLGVRVFFTKKGEFPSLHIGSSRAMQDRGIHCASSQDAEMYNRENLLEKILKSEN